VSAAEEFRQHAAACVRAAQLALVPEVKATLIDMAQHWNQLADHMDRLAVAETLAARHRPDPGVTRHAGRE
jgi:hypothetical protein